MVFLFSSAIWSSMPAHKFYILNGVKMNITYDDMKKDLPVEQLHRLFVSVGWASETMQGNRQRIGKTLYCTLSRFRMDT